MIRSLLLVTLAAASCSGPRETLSVHGVDLVVGAWSVERGDGYHLKACLREPAVVDGLPVERWIRFHDEDVLAQCFLADDAEVQGKALPRGSCLWFDRQGRLDTVWLAEDAVFDGILCDGGWGKIAVAFHPNGRLRSAFLVEDAVIQGVPCLASVLHPVAFDADGRLVRCAVSRWFVLGGRAYARGDELELKLPRDG